MPEPLSEDVLDDELSTELETMDEPASGYSELENGQGR